MDQVKGKSIPRNLQEAEPKQQKRPRRSRRATLLKIMIVPLLLFFSLVIGLIIGYSVIGKMPASDVFDLNTYKHMYDLIFSGT